MTTPADRSPMRPWLLAAWTTLAIASGYFLLPVGATAARKPVCRGEYPPVGLKLPSAWGKRDDRPKQPAPAHNYVMPPWVPLNAVQRQIVAASPEEVRERVARGMTDFKYRLCRKTVPSASEALCRKAAAMAVDAEVRHNLAYRGFLAGQIDQDHFQDDYHRASLELQVRLEQTFDYADGFAYAGVRYGEDPFLTNIHWGVDLPPNWKLGDDVISGDTADDPESPPGADVTLPEDPNAPAKPGINLDGK